VAESHELHNILIVAQVSLLCNKIMRKSTWIIPKYIP